MKRLVLILLLFYSATRVKCRPESENSQHPSSVTNHSEPHEHNEHNEHNEHHELEDDAEAEAEGAPHAEASHDNKTHDGKIK